MGIKRQRGSELGEIEKEGECEWRERESELGERE